MKKFYVDFSFMQAHPTMTLEEYFKIEQERLEEETRRKEEPWLNFYTAHRIGQYLV